MRLLWGVFLITGLVLSLVACGGGKKETARTLDDAGLRDMVMITSEGLPWDVTLANDEAVSNEVAASQYPDQQQWVSNYEEWGRTGGHFASFIASNGEVSVTVEVESYGSQDGAEKAWVAVRQFVLSQAQSGEGVPPVEEASAKKIGDESVALYFGVSTEGSESYTILFRRGEVVALAGTGAGEGAVSVGDVEALAQQLDTRIQDILKR
jgi:hypothetical protein